MAPGINRASQLVEKVFLSIFWVLRTLRYQWQNCGQLEVRKVSAWEGALPLPFLQTL